MVRAAKKDRFSLKYILILAAAVILLTQSGWMTQKDVHYVPVRIHKGDTVWDIAATAAGDSEDVRHIVWDIVKTNNLPDDQQIHPGQVLQIPLSTAARHRLQNKFDVTT